MKKTARLYNCTRCHIQVTICRSCDRGNNYCAGCAPVAHAERLRRAGKRYQSSAQGKLNHAARQQRYRQRQREKVTHQGSQRVSLRDLLRSRSKMPVTDENPLPGFKNGIVSCHTCSSICAPFLRLQYLRTG